MTVTLDDSQLAVVEADPDARLLVTAGAGRGKTEVVAARIGFLVAEHGLVPADEVLVLTFSRAAVAAATRRLDSAATPVATVSTFDSFASRLLMDSGADLGEIVGFDARIRGATKLIRSRELPALDMLRHVVFDEVQDLVGDRAVFALALLDRVSSECGFTALGDPLQAIYDWQIGSGKPGLTVTDLESSMVDELGAVRRTLEVDHRARGIDPKRVIGLGDELRAAADGPTARRIIHDFESTLPDIGSLVESANLVGRAEVSTAVLCRTNGEALAVGRVLRDNKVAHVVRRPLEDVGAAPWIATALAGIDAPTVSREHLHQLLLNTDTPIGAVEAWTALKTAERGRSRTSLNFHDLRFAVRNRSLPMELTARDQADVIVSTIHRAKGLEFDRVFVVEPSYRHKDEDDWSEVRTGFVALSRARDDLVRCTAPPWSRNIRRGCTGRWTALTRAKRVWAMEAAARDIDVTRPAADTDGNGALAQRELAAPGVVGSVLTARLETDSPHDCPRYGLSLATADVPIGRTSEKFGTDLVRTFGARRRGQVWPRIIEGIEICAAETVAGDPDLCRSAKIGASGFWLVPRLTGLARPDWASADEE